MQMKTAALLLSLTFAYAAERPGPAPRLDSWKVIGPGGGGTMIEPVVSPHDTNLVVEHCDMTGAYITLDGAQSWRMFNLRTVVSTLAFDPHDAKVIYAGNAALWRSEDTGRSWSMVFPNPGRNTVEHQLGDHADARLTSDDDAYPRGFNISRIAVDPADPKRIYVVFSGRPTIDTAKREQRTDVLLVSNDRGRSWTRKAVFEGRSVRALDPDDAGLTIVLNDGVILEAGGKQQTFPSPARLAKASCGRANGALHVYATSDEGKLYVSRDGGRTWSGAALDLGKQPGRLEAISTSAKNAQVAYVGFRGLTLDEGRANGIAKTEDGGRTWRIVHQEAGKPSANLEASWIEPRAAERGRDIWFDAPVDVGAAPTNPDICYATDLFRTYRTLDGGKTWKQVNSVHAGEDRWTTRGLDVTTNYGLFTSIRSTRNTVIIAYTDIGAFQSYDSGATWTGATVGIPMRWRNTTYWLEFDPKVKGLLWGGFSGVHDLPRPKMFRRHDPEKFIGGVGVSIDGGKTWQVSDTGMPDTSVTHILLDPASPAGNRTLYACGFGRGVYKSTDGGKTWQLKNTGIEEKKPFAWRITRAANGTLYLVVARSNEGRYGETAGSGALYKSTDGAAHLGKDETARRAATGRTA